MSTFTPNFELLATSFEEMKELARRNSEIDRSRQPVTDEIIRNLDWVRKTLRDGSDECDPRTGRRVHPDLSEATPHQRVAVDGSHGAENPANYMRIGAALVSGIGDGDIKYTVDLQREQESAKRRWLSLGVEVEGKSYRRILIDTSALYALIDCLRGAHIEVERTAGGESRKWITDFYGALEDDFPF